MNTAIAVIGAARKSRVARVVDAIRSYFRRLMGGS